ncbi:hypothetical protein [Rhodococcus sp. ANT_H53B]|uniref:hypothetical protein n=1 Tax=Rhodococcus sp. ANT_H53B TaxID=2597357 RepID=UPI0011EBA5EE|nr:hypothetical protein [Rhodococcus sp. ANT_H53B]KAA0925962.1 hypothetical protein FQ188_10435 [Rhodococcus sp. ANT_H53B]
MPGRHEEKLELAVRTARDEGLLDDKDEALVSAARASARALDDAEGTPKGGYITSQILAPYREILAELKLTPASRDDSEGAVDPITELMNEMEKRDNSSA